MAFAFLPFPYLNTYSLTVQLFLLVGILTLTYRYRTFRTVVLAILSVYTIYKTAVPLARWAYAAFKAIAWFGFYVNFFMLGLGYLFTGAMGVWNFPELLKTFVDSMEGK